MKIRPGMSYVERRIVTSELRERLRKISDDSEWLKSYTTARYASAIGVTRPTVRHLFGSGNVGNYITLKKVEEFLEKEEARHARFLEDEDE